MNDNEIIICANCYEENENTRTTCKKCGAKLYNNNAEKQATIEKKEIKQDSNSKEEYVEESYFTDKNIVALVIKVIAIVGATVGFIYGCTLFDSAYTEELGIIYIVVSIISAVFIYALGEIIQKLQNIEDNTRK